MAVEKKYYQEMLLVVFERISFIVQGYLSL